MNMVNSLPSPVNNVKIRFKHTSLSSYSAATFESDGWIVVYYGQWPAQAGWVNVNLDTPFFYNGVDNLLIDISFDRSEWSSSSLYTKSTETGIARSLYAASDGSVYDPQIWGLGGLGAASAISTKIPNIKLNFESKSKWQHLGIMCFNNRYANNVEQDPCDNYTSVPAGCTPRRDRILEMVKTASKSFGSDGPDIIGMQEVYDRRNHIFDVVNGLDYKYSWTGISETGTMSVDEGHSYNVIFYKKERFSAKDQGAFWLTETPDVCSIHPDTTYVRTATWVILHDKLTNRDYFILDTHLDVLTTSARECGAKIIMDKLVALAGNLPIIIMGDMNGYETGDFYKIFTGQLYQDDIILHDFYREIHPVKQPVERTFQSFDGTVNGSRVDYIMGRDFICKGASIERGKVSGRYPSDHYPVTVHLYVPNDRLADLNNDEESNLLDINVFCDDWLNTEQLLTCNTTNDGLLARWPFDQTIGGLGFTQGIINGAAVFDGFSDSIYSSANYSGGRTLSNWTIAVWVRLDRMPYETSSGYYMMNIVGDENKNAGSIQLSVRSNAKLRLEVFSTDNGGLETAYNENPLLTNQWYHVAVVYSRNPNQVKFYIDGELECVRNLTNQVLCWIGPLYIGKYADSRFLDGTLDELRIYNRQLMEDEIEYLSAGGSSPGTVTQKLEGRTNFINDQTGIINFRDFTEFIWNFK